MVVGLFGSMDNGIFCKSTLAILKATLTTKARVYSLEQIIIFSEVCF